MGGVLLTSKAWKGRSDTLLERAEMAQRRA